MNEIEQLQRSLSELNETLRDLLSELRSQRTKQAYSVKEVAQLLGRSEWTVRRWVRQGTIEGAHVADNDKSPIVIPRWEVERLLSAGVGD